MIIFELVCDNAHRFEGWFGSSSDFDRQCEQKLLACPVCATAQVRKLPTAKIKRSEAEAPRAPTNAQPPQPGLPAVAEGQPADPRLQMMALIDHILTNAENVGDQFATEARKIHRQEVPNRSIRGVATKEEAESLIEEGVPVLPLPVPPTGEWH